MLILSNDEIRSLLTMEDCIHVLEAAYLERFHQRALSRPRTDVYAPKEDGGQYVFKTLEGILPSENITALRVNSDIIQWKKTDSGTRKEKVPLADGNWVGLVCLFDMNNGKLLSIMPDGVIQGFRVGASSGLSIKYMSRPDSKTMGLFGTGWQAENQVKAACAVRNLDYVKVYSPTKGNREEFADRMSRTVGIPVIPVDGPEQAAEGLDIVSTCTNSLATVVQSEWISKGTHVTCVKHLELASDLVSRADVVCIHTQLITPENYFIGRGEQKIYGIDPTEQGEYKNKTYGWEQSPELHTVIGRGVRGRESPDQITCFINNMGLGLQFAAVGALVYQKSVERHLGINLPDTWFVEDIPS